MSGKLRNYSSTVKVSGKEEERRERKWHHKRERERERERFDVDVNFNGSCCTLSSCHVLVVAHHRRHFKIFCSRARVEFKLEMTVTTRSTSVE